ncbi:hypothetical protein GGQ85_000179 [Nitrobacter vulgaris]|nr:hypothetical protein [Nitrobacter vulgaris]
MKLAKRAWVDLDDVKAGQLVLIFGTPAHG